MENKNFTEQINSIKEQAQDLSSICQLLYGICNSELIEENFQYMYIFTRIIFEQSEKLKNDIYNFVA